MNKKSDPGGLGRLILSAAICSQLCGTLLAQKDRLPATVDPGRQAVLAGVVRKEAQARYDQGPVSPELRIGGISLMLKMSAAQQADLDKLLENQRDPSSPDYHAWLTPDQYADRFGLSPADIGRITAWLREAGLSVDHVARSRNWILFGGTAGQLQRAFGTSIHHYLVDGVMHYANAAAPSIPAALEPVVQTIFDLDDFRPKPPSHKMTPSDSPKPDYTNNTGDHYLSPGDLAVIYGLTPLYAKGFNGTGQKVAVIGQTAVKVTDMQMFRSTFSLPASDPQMILVPGSTNPGITNGDEGEADLDLEWAGATAPNATILYVYSTNVFTSANYAVSQALAPVMTLSYGFCEQNISGNPVTSSAAFRTVAQQANTEGITYLASSGDSGSADCDLDTAASAKNGLSVNMPASIPEVTGVGGTEFNEGALGSKYWNSGAPTSALSYIPEMAWNDSGAGTASSSGLATTGGGLSEFYAKPAWQTGPGVPADGQRDVPDVSFTASADHDGYIIFSEGKEFPIGGTSASAPAFAGMLALLNQYLVTNGSLAQPGLGNINPNLYSLAQNTTGIFHDVTVGSNIVPCGAGTTNCVNGKVGYTTGAGYDVVTGLGSLDMNALATQWGGKPPTTSTTTAVTANPATFAVGASATVTATVKAASGTATPTGSVSFSAGNNSLGEANLTGTGGAATASVTVSGNLLATGANTIKATYSGTTSFSGSSGSATVTVTVPTTASAVVPSVTPNPVYQQPADANGNRWFFTVKLSEIAGVATTFTSFSIGGVDNSASIPALFGSNNMAAHGTLSAAVATNVTAAPSNITLSFGGADAGGAKWTQQISVPLYGAQLTGSLALSSAPGTEVLNASGEPSCSGSGIYQELNLQELNGHGVTITKFLAAGNDLTADTSVWFGSWRIAPLGTLQARLCWPVTSGDLPTTYNYEIDGLDDQGRTVTTTLTVPFLPAAPNPGALSPAADISLAALPGLSTTATVAVKLPAGQPWTVSKFPANQNTGWLVATPQSGTGPGTVNVTLNSASLPVGIYRATLVLQSVNTVPQFQNVTVSLTVGTASASAPLTIAGVANGASFQQKFAPGMILSVFGANLTNSATALFAPSVPLPFTMGGTTVTINGVPAPFYYASKTQMNIQVPYETGSGYALLAIANGCQVAGQYFLVSDSAPGIFVGNNSALVPLSTAKRGDIVTLFMTGEGDVSPTIATGATPTTDTPLSQLPFPRLKPFTVTVAGAPVTPAFVGIPYGLVGETQINFPIPTNTPLGPQKVIVTSGANSSVAAIVNVTQ